MASASWRSSVTGRMPPSRRGARHGPRSRRSTGRRDAARSRSSRGSVRAGDDGRRRPTMRTRRAVEDREAAAGQRGDVVRRDAGPPRSRARRHRTRARPDAARPAARGCRRRCARIPSGAIRRTRRPAGIGDQDAAAGVDVDARRAHEARGGSPARRRPCSAARLRAPRSTTGARSGAARRIRPPATSEQVATSSSPSGAYASAGAGADRRRDGDEAPVAQRVDVASAANATVPSGRAASAIGIARMSASAASTPGRSSFGA